MVSVSVRLWIDRLHTAMSLHNPHGQITLLGAVLPGSQAYETIQGTIEILLNHNIIEDGVVLSQLVLILQQVLG
jgi:hypothetical protein